MKKHLAILIIICVSVAFCMFGTGTFAATSYSVTSVYDLQSAHMYSGMSDITWTYTYPVQAEKLEITFSTDTKTQANCDYIYILDANGNQLGRYSGTELAGKTLSVNGNSFKVRLTSDFSISDYGFRVTKIKGYSSADVTTLSEGTCGTDVSWKLTSDGVLTIDGTGDMKNYTGTNSPWYSSRSKILKVIIKDGVTSVGNCAFYYCNHIQEVSIGKDVKTIGTNVFYSDYDLNEITLPKSLESVGNYAFENCKSLTDVYYHSTESDFANISVGTNNTYLTNAAKHYLLSGSCGENLTWVLGFDSILSISGEGDMENFENPASVPWYSKRSAVKGINISDNVTSIGDYAFYYICNVEEIKIPSSVTCIGKYAFYECSKITSVTIPDSVETIGDKAFSYCSNLKNIYIGKNVSSIGEQAFYYASTLSEIRVSEENQNFSSSDGVLFDKNRETLIWYPKGKTATSYVVPSTVKTIGDYAFYYNSTLRGITLPENLCTIGSDAFSVCSNISSFEIPESVGEIGTYAFSSCSKLERVNLPSSLLKIESGIFSGCSSLSEIQIPQSVESIGSSAFSSCRKLAEIAIPEKVTMIGSYAFSECSSLTYLNIPRSVTQIGSDAFSNCSLLEKIDLGENVETIGSGAFKNCTSLSFVKLPSKLLEIGYDTFKGCTALLEITVPDSVGKIGNSAFSGCSSLKYIKLGKGLTSVLDNAFYMCTSLDTVDVSDIDSYFLIDFEKSTASPAVYADELLENGVEVTNLYISPSITKVKTYAISYKNIKSVTADEENAEYSSIDGVLFDKNKTSLIFYPSGKADKSYTVPETVTSLATGSFSNCTFLESVSIPASVKSLGQSFSNCLSLKSVEYLGNNDERNLNGNNVFSGCSNLETIICPNVKKISNFRDLTKLKRAQFDSARDIYEYTFYNCISLEHIELPILDTVQQYTFANCSNLKSELFIANPSSLSIGKYAFYNCSSMPGISIASGYTYNIGSCAFSGCSSLKHIYISQGAGDISGSSYKVDFGQFSKSSISSNAFSGVTADVYLPNGYYEYDYGDFGGNLTWIIVKYGTCGKGVYWNYNENSKLLYISGNGEIKNYWLSGSDTPWTYYGDVIEKVTVSSGITHIDSYTFEYLTSVKEIQLPNTLKTLAYNAFNDCENFDNLMLPASLESFTETSYNGFIRCKSLKNVYYMGTEEEFRKITGWNYAGEDGRTVHCLLWNESTETCTEPGVEGYYSFDDTSVYSQMYDVSKKEISYLKSVPATGHSVVFKEEIRANCHETGKKARYECENCGLVFEDEKGTVEKTDYITEIDSENHDGETELRGNENGYTGDTYCLGCENVISYGENIYKIQILGDESGEVNAKGIMRSVRLGTGFDASLAYVYVKYPDFLRITEIRAKDFSYALTEDEYTKDGYTTTVILAQYSDNEYIPKDVIMTPFEMIFDISESAPVGTAQIEITDESCLVGNDEHRFDEIICSTLEILPKLSESIEIYGEDIISGQSQYTATVLPSYATDKSVQWSVDNDSIATIDQAGLLTPKTSGTVTVTAMAKDGSGVLASKTVEVIKFAESIEILGDDEIFAPTKYTAVVLPDFATNKKVKWSVDDTSVATVDDDGMVTPLKNGKISLTATMDDESGLYFEKTIVVTVNIRLENLTTNTGEWNREFSSDVTEYTINLPEGTEEIIFTPSFKNAVLKVNGIPVGNGREKRISLTENETTVVFALTPVGESVVLSNTYTVTLVRGSFTKSKVSESGKSINVTPVNIGKGKMIILTLFNGEKLAGVYYRIYDGDTVSFDVSEDYTSAKVMVWDSLSGIRPECRFEKIK